MRLTISRKFWAVLAVLAPLIVATGIAGVRGLASMKSGFDQVFADNIHTSQVSTSLGADLDRADEIALQLLSTTDPAQRLRLNATLDQTVVPAVEYDLNQLNRLHAENGGSERARVQRLFRGWSRFVALRDTGVLAAKATSPATSPAINRLATEINGIFEPLAGIIATDAQTEAAAAGAAHARAVHTYTTSELLIWGIALAAFALGTGSVLLLIRDVVPRIKGYSRFAASVAAGDLSERLNPQGSDELATLGQALDDMVARRAAGAAHQEVQTEFVDTLQVTNSEEVAHDLLKRQVERSITGSSVVVLNRNNSDDRLEATTVLPPGSPLKETLTDAKPRSCRAVLFARSHTEDPEREPLSRCDVCGKTGRRSTCEPLLVSGEVIGSVLVQHDDELSGLAQGALRESVTQAAPVLANLRNLALAEFRAATDSLTGLSNKRAVQDTVKRMAAQAGRTLTPLSAIVLDLDHFKKINDSFGHGRGDDVLAAVGAVLPTLVRSGDFVGRYGGEEFIVLMADTETEGAALLAEKIRVAIAEIAVPGVEREITASLGVATIPHHAGTSDQLVRNADRALYVAKTNGRNRVEIAVALAAERREAEPVEAA
ncbi:MAG TPA: diguanylate cyclase [Solirubrobacteraceae bacterium]|jgi:diguanylate cyclase (GGDEF)-like protein|nr:diguanylate cyclase [Solirubrobacteraceae bacterium]